MGNVHMEASQINYRGGETKMSVEEAIKAGSSYTLPIASAETLGGVKIGSGISIAEGGAISADAQLPEDPETDGVKVLTATTTSGETVKSWEEPSGGVDYTTTEQNTGTKWIDGKDIYCKTIDFGALPNNTTKSVSSGLTNEFIVKMDAFAYKTDAFYPLPFVSVTTLNDCIRSGYNIGNHTVDIVTSGDKSAISAYVTLYYTKTTV